MTAIYKRELKSYFTGITGFIIIAFMLMVVGIYASVINFMNAYPNFELVIVNASFIFLIIVPLLTMRSIAEEKRQKTEQLLYSLPISMTQVVMGKYLAMLTVFAIPVALCCVYPLVLSLYDPSGSISYPAAYSTLFAFFLLGAALIAIGMFMSSLTENVIISAVLCFGVMLVSFLMQSLKSILPSSANAAFIGFIVMALLVCLLLFFMTKNGNAAWLLFIICCIPLTVIKFVKSEWLDGKLVTVLGSISMFDKLSGFADGVFDVTAVVYLVSVAALFVFFTVQVMEKRRWS